MHGATPARVQILLLNWNGWRDTIECLRSVYELAYPDFGIVVCDNGSGDSSLARIREWAEHPSRQSRVGTIVEIDRPGAETGSSAADLLLIQTGDNLGFAGGNNVGLRYLLRRDDCEYIWLLNNDTVVAPDALDALVRHAESDPLLGAVGGTLLMEEPDVVQDAGGISSAWHGMSRAIGAGQRAADLPPEPPRLDYVSGGCLLVRLATVRQVGLLDERFFMYSEDADWGIRLRQAGFRLAVSLKARVWHKGGGSVHYHTPRHDYYVTKSALLFMQKHYPARLPFAFIYSLYRCLLPKIVRLQWRRFLAVLRAYRDIIEQMRPGRAAPRPPFSADGARAPSVAPQDAASVRR